MPQEVEVVLSGAALEDYQRAKRERDPAVFNAELWWRSSLPVRSEIDNNRMLRAAPGRATAAIDRRLVAGALGG